jgi:hypothetical protein
LIVKPPVVAGVNPVRDPIAAFGENPITSVAATPVAETVNVAQDAVEMEPRLFIEPAPVAAVRPLVIVLTKGYVPSLLKLQTKA